MGMEIMKLRRTESPYITFYYHNKKRRLMTRRKRKPSPRQQVRSLLLAIALLNAGKSPGWTAELLNLRKIPSPTTGGKWNGHYTKQLWIQFVLPHLPPLQGLPEIS